MPFLDITLPELIASVGYIGVFLMVFVESGVPIGIILPLPGDTLLFSAGILAATSVFDLLPLIATVIVAAILGDSVGYWCGKKYGPKLFTKEQGVMLNKRHLDRAEQFFKKFGPMAIILARFLPFFRTVVPIAAGVGSMHYATFLTFNVVGAFIWGISIPLLGYYLGSLIPNIDHYLLPIVIGIAAITTLGILWEMRRAKKESVA